MHGKASPLMDWKVVGLSGYLPICLSICLSVYLSVYLATCLSIELSSIYLSVCLCACLSVYLSVFLPVKLSICLSICLSVYLWWRCLLYPPSFLKLLQNRHVFLTFGKVLNPFPLPHRMAIEPPKMLTTWTCDVFTTFDFEMCFAPQRPALFHYLNFQSVPNMWCCTTFDFEMCFAPQLHALFQRVNFQKWSGTEALSCFFMFFHVFSTFWLRHVLRTKTPRAFLIISTQLSKELRTH